MEDNHKDYLNLHRFIMGRSESHAVIFTTRSDGEQCKIFEAIVYLTDIDAEYAVLRFGVILKEKDET